MILKREFYLQSTKKVARDLIGKFLVIKDGRKIRRCQIIETEAYLGVKDRAAHSFGGRKTERVQAMYLNGGHAYVYFIYGMYFCFNVVTRKEGIPEAVLIRALHEEGTPDRELAGPGKLCRALNITKKDNLLDLTLGRRIWIEDSGAKRPKLITCKRIGVDGYGEAAHHPLRYYWKDHPAVSKK